MFYPNTKVYFDGSHFIGIPQTSQPWKKKKQTSKTKDKLEVEFDNLYKENKELSKIEKKEIILNELKEEFESEEKAEEFIKQNFERKRRNESERRKRLYRKVYLQKWNYFCTFTFDDKKLSEFQFKEKLTNCLRHLASRNDWKYIGVWERSPNNNRLHFHGLFYTPTMVGMFEEIKDYSTEKHKMQIANQNTFFADRFGRNDFKEINEFELSQAVRYLTKYIEKSGERIVYSKGLATYFVSNIIEQDVVCTIGKEDRKLLLFDDFHCIIEDEFMGRVSPEVIQKMPKSN